MDAVDQLAMSGGVLASSRLSQKPHVHQGFQVILGSTAELHTIFDPKISEHQDIEY